MAKSKKLTKQTKQPKKNAKKKNATPKAPKSRMTAEARAAKRKQEAKEAQLFEALQFRQRGVSIAQTASALGIPKSEQDVTIGRYVLVAYIPELKLIYRDAIYFGQTVPDYVVDACRFYGNFQRKLPQYRKAARVSPSQKKHNQLTEQFLHDLAEDLLKNSN
jgi:hypothetical protein